jgi:LysR family positive regulator for ilvC
MLPNTQYMISGDGSTCMSARSITRGCQTVDFQSMKLFLSLARNLHFGRSSAECHVSPSALSRSIQRLEEQVGHQLVLRDNRSVALTREGELFRAFASETLERWHSTQQLMSTRSGRLSGHISLFASVTATQSFLPTVLSRFRRTHPDIHIQLETGYAVDALQRLQEGIDVVVTSLDNRDDRNLAKRIIMSIPVVTIAPVVDCEVSRLVEKGQIDWSGIPLILPKSGSSRRDIDQWLLDLRVSPNIYSEVDGNEAVMSMVALGCGVGFIPRLVVEKSPLQAQVQIIKSGPDLNEFHVGFCARKKRLAMSPLVKAFWESID